MFGLAINLLGIKKAIGAVFTWATANMARMLAIMLALAVLWAVVERHGKHKAQRVLASTVTAWKAAEREATAAQIAANSAQQDRWAQQARNVDHDYQKARVDADSRSERFIRSGGLRCPANPRGPGGGDPVQSPNPATGIDGAGSEAVLVTVAPDDVRICSENTLRLQAAREWALTLAD